MTDYSPVVRAKKLAIHFGANASSKVSLMLGRQNFGGHTATQRELPAGAIGVLGAAELSTSGNVCFFTGVPIHGPGSRATDAESAARLFPVYDGAFTGVFWDAQRGWLVVVTDCLGLDPLYMSRAGGELTLVSDTKALGDGPDLAAWGAFISIGHPIGDRSLVSGLKRVPAASVLTYDCARRELSIRRYWEWPAPSEAWRHYDFLDALERDILSYAALGNPGTLLLSGGFDSRLLLFLLRRACIPAQALIVAHEDEHGDADGRLAQAVATLAGMPARKVYPPPDFFSSTAYLDYLRASDVGYPSLDLFIAKVASQIQSAAVWDGLVPGFVFMPLHQPEGGFDAYLRQEIQGPESPIWRAAKVLFKPEVLNAMAEGFSRDMQSERSRLPRDTTGLARFVIENRSRNRASMNPLKVYANRTDTFIPGLSKEFMTHAATIPFHEKRRARFYREVFARLDKRSLSVPFLSGGNLMKGAGTNPAFYRELLRLELEKYRVRYPRLFPATLPHLAQRSTYLGKHLLEDDDPWIDPEARDKLIMVDKSNYLAWKLLFHWKAWQWVHTGRLQVKLGSHAIADHGPAQEVGRG